MYEASGGGAGYNSYGGAAPQQMQTSPYSVQRPGGPGIYGGPPTGSPGGDPLSLGVLKSPAH